MNEKRCLSKRGQITIFIIMAIAIVIVLVLLFVGKEGVFSVFIPETPMEQIKDCIQVAGEEGLSILNMQGGSINPENYFLYDSNKVEYLCYNEEDYKTCVMQKPLLRKSVEWELGDYIKSKATVCIEGVKSSLEKKGYSVESKEPMVSVELALNSILIDTELDLRVEKEGVNNYKNIKIDIDSELYRFVIIASSILNWEAKYGDTEILNYMVYDPLMKVEKKKQGDGSKIYILTSRNTEEEFLFATRSVALPPGLVGGEY